MTKLFKVLPVLVVLMNVLALTMQPAQAANQIFFAGMDAKPTPVPTPKPKPPKPIGPRIDDGD